MSMQRNRKTKIGLIIYNHIINNKREYLIITILFFIGLIVGVLFINNLKVDKIEEICSYLENLFNNIQNYEKIDSFNLLKKSLFSNLIVVLLLWFGASTIVGIPIVYGCIMLKGFSIGYTISSIIIYCGVWKGIVISLTALLLHNIIFIPAMFSICISGAKLYKSIMKNKNRKNIKLEILRHTLFCMIMLILMIFSSLVETYISTNMLIIILKYIKI